MKKELDVFGLAMKDYLNGERGQIIHVDTTYTEDEELPVDYLFRSEEELPEYEKLALTHCKGRILDVGAGAGCHTKILHEKGFDVLALDYAPFTVELLEKQQLPAICEDFYQFKDAKPFDTLLFLMNGIGMAHTLEGLKPLLEKAKSLLSEEGQILLESSDILYLFEEEDGSYLIDLNGAYYGELEYFLTYKDVQAEPFPWLYVGYEILQDHAEQVGLACEILFLSDEGNYIAKLTHKK